MSARPLDVTPRLMRPRVAAQYIGVSETTLRGLGLPRRLSGTMVLYDRHDLDAWADSLAYDAPAREEGTECADRVFGS